MSFKQTQPENLISPELTLFEDSILGLYLGQDAASTFSCGSVFCLSEGDYFIVRSSDMLAVVLDGVLASDLSWKGPGCHIHGTGEQFTAKESKVILWVWQSCNDTVEATALQTSQVAVRNALDAADRALRAATPLADLPASDSLSDIKHPDIQRVSSQLCRTTPAATAEAIFLFVQALPYRFGTWQERASDTLARGCGMCTTKANIQVTLMRAAGLEAGFVEMPMSMRVLGRLMPAAWLPMMRPVVRHYFGAVKLGGRWHAADSSFTDTCMRMHLENVPAIAHLLPARLSEGQPYNPAAENNGLDPFDIDVVPHLNSEMSKTTRFTSEHFEALNTRLDRVQGCWRKWT